MKFDELKNSLKVKIEPIYLLEGEESFFRERGEALIKNTAVTEPQLNFTTVDVFAIKQAPENLVNALESCPFMSEKRMVTVYEWYPTASELKNKVFKTYFDLPYDTAVLCIVNSKKCDALKKLETVTFVDCSKADETLISKYIRSLVTKDNLIISSSVCTKITEYCQFDLTRIDCEVKKLVSYCSGKTEITLEDVEKMVSKTTDYQIYEMVGFIAEKKYNSAYEILKELGDSPERQVLFASVYYHFRKLFFVAVSDSSDAVIARELGMKEFAVKYVRRQAKLFSAKRLKKIMDKLSCCDADFKCGKLNFDNAFFIGMFTVLCEE